VKRLGKKGFTLVELMVVIVIIGILVAIIVPSVTSAVNSAKKQSALADAKSQLTTWSIEVATAGSTTAQYFEGDDKTPLPLTEAEALRIAGEKVFMKNTELGDIVIENGTARWAEADEFPPDSGDYYEMKVDGNVITITKMTA
jgi:prepilin-type N-terminal cleavage/methylation domain-containing protein